MLNFQGWRKMVRNVFADIFSARTRYLKSVIIPDSVTSIGSSAFEGCSNLESITIPDSVRNIEEKAFKGTIYDIDSVNLKSDVLYIGNILIEAKKHLAECIE